MRLQQVMLTMNKEDLKEQVLTFPAWLSPLLPNLMLTLQGLIIHCNKKYHLLITPMKSRHVHGNLYYDGPDNT